MRKRVELGSVKERGGERTDDKYIHHSERRESGMGGEWRVRERRSAIGRVGVLCIYSIVSNY